MAWLHSLWIVMLILNVPFAEKDQAKALGARWNATIKKWCVPDGTPSTAFASWLTEGAAPGAAVKAAAKPGKVDSYTGKTVTGSLYFDVEHDCNPLTACMQCQALLDSSGWNAARAKNRDAIAASGT